MSRYIPVLYKPKWQRVIINQQTGLLYKKYFLSDRAIQFMGLQNWAKAISSWKQKSFRP
jgi:hypothetical protein